MSETTCYNCGLPNPRVFARPSANAPTVTVRGGASEIAQGGAMTFDEEVQEIAKRLGLTVSEFLERRIQEMYWLRRKVHHGHTRGSRKSPPCRS
jgi:hypothetical protein